MLFPFTIVLPKADGKQILHFMLRCSTSIKMTRDVIIHSAIRSMHQNYDFQRLGQFSNSNQNLLIITKIGTSDFEIKNHYVCEKCLTIYLDPWDRLIFNVHEFDTWLYQLRIYSIHIF